MIERNREKPRSKFRERKPNGRPPDPFSIEISKLSVGEAYSTPKTLARVKSLVTRGWLPKNHPSRRYRIKPRDDGRVFIIREPDIDPALFPNILEMAQAEARFFPPTARGKAAYVTVPRSEPFASHCEGVGFGKFSKNVFIITIPNGRKAAMGFCDILEEYAIRCKVRLKTP